jgi:hypothetical protein
MSGHPVVARVSAALIGMLALQGCVTPAIGPNQYRAKARMSVQAAISETQTARITLHTLEKHRIFATTADETVTATETALGSISTAFGSVQPPPEADTVHDQTITLLSDAEDALVGARIATRRSDPTAIRKALTGLASVTKRLQRAEKRLS